MSTFVQFIECPEAYTPSVLLAKNPAYVTELIKLITKQNNPLLCNERECYVYPKRAAKILTEGDTYKLLATSNHLFFLFSNFSTTEPILLGYINTILLSLVKKTPEIYEYFKDHQDHLTNILLNGSILCALKEFVAVFLLESTMDLYTFLKSMCVRTLIAKAIKQQNPVFIETLFMSYDMIRKVVPLQQQKEELNQVRGFFQDQTFVSVLILQLDCRKSQRTQIIAKYLKLIVQEHAELVLPYSQTITQYFEAFQDSEQFLQKLKCDQIEMLKMLCELIKFNKKDLFVSQVEKVTQQLLKRLLVYSNVYDNASVIHSLLYNLMQQIHRLDRDQYLQSVIKFLSQTEGKSKYGFNALKIKVAKFWQENKIKNLCQSQEDKQFVLNMNLSNLKLSQCKYYK